jgi:hypothetical protein
MIIPKHTYARFLKNKFLKEEFWGQNVNSSFSLSLRNTFQDSQWIPETRDNMKPDISGNQ